MSLQNWESFYGLELWWDIKLFKQVAVQDPSKGRACALELLSLYLMPHSEKLIFPPSVRNKPELQRFLKEINTILESDRPPPKTLFNDLLCYVSTLVNAGRWNSKIAGCATMPLWQETRNKPLASAGALSNSAGHAKDGTSAGPDDKPERGFLKERTNSFRVVLNKTQNRSAATTQATTGPRKARYPFMPLDHAHAGHFSFAPRESIQDPLDRIALPFRRMLKATVIGPAQTISQFLSLFSDDLIVIGDTLLKINPFVPSTQTRFFQKLILANHGLLVFTSFTDVLRYKYLENFYSMPHLVVDMTYAKSPQANTKFEKLRRYPPLVFERSLSQQARVNQLTQALEQIVQDKKYNLGQTLQVEFPYYIQHITNALLRASQATLCLTSSKLQQLMIDALLSRDESAIDMTYDPEQMVPLSIFVYDSNGFNATKRVLAVKDVAHIPLTEVLIVHCRVDRELVEHATLFGKHRNVLQADSTVTSTFGIVHVIAKWETVKRNVLFAFERMGFIYTSEDTPDTFILDPSIFVNVCSSLLEERSVTDKATGKEDKKALSSSSPPSPSPVITQQNLLVLLRMHSQQLGIDERVLLTLLKSYEMVYFDSSYAVQLKLLSSTLHFNEGGDAQNRYFVPVTALHYIPKKGQIPLADQRNAKKERKIKRYFAVKGDMPVTFMDRMFASLYCTYRAVCNDPDPVIILKDNMVLFTLKLTAASTIAFEFFANVIAVKFLGNLADVPYFCKLCNLLRIIIKNIYYRLSVQELAECPHCETETFPIEDLLSFFFMRERLWCTQDANIVLELETLVPECGVETGTVLGIPKAPVYSVTGKLGEGAFGIVNRAVISEGPHINVEVAIKKFRTPNSALGWEAFQEFQYEAMLVNTLDNKYILKQIGIDMTEFALMQEIAPKGVLGDILHNNKSAAELPRLLKQKMCIDIAKGLGYLHSRVPPIIHRDLRSFNIFVMSTEMGMDVNVKIGDFGLSVISYAPTDEPLESWQWMAPEVISGVRCYDERSDLYSLGIVIYEIFSRVLPFTNMPSLLHVTEKPIKKPDALSPSNYTKDLVEQCEKQGLEVDLKNWLIIKREFKTMQAKQEICEIGLRPKIPDDFQADLINLLNLCWDASPENRPPALEVATLVGALDVLSGVSRPENVLQVNPNIKTRPVLSIATKGCGHVRTSTVYYNKQEERSNKRESRRLRAETRGSAPPVKLLENIKLIQRRESALWSGEELNELEEGLACEALERPLESGEAGSPSKLSSSQSPPTSSPTNSNSHAPTLPAPQSPSYASLSTPSLPLPDFAFPTRPIAQPTYKRGFPTQSLVPSPMQRPHSLASAPLNVLMAGPGQFTSLSSSSPRRFEDAPIHHDLLSSDERMEQDWVEREENGEEWQEFNEHDEADSNQAGEGTQHVQQPTAANPKLNVKVPHIIQPRNVIHSLNNSPSGSLIARKKRASTASDLKMSAEELQNLLGDAHKKGVKEAATVDGPTHHGHWQESYKSDEAKERDKEGPVTRDRAQGRSGLIGARPNRAASSEASGKIIQLPNRTQPNNSSSNSSSASTNNPSPNVTNPSPTVASSVPSSGLGSNPRKAIGSPTGVTIPQSFALEPIQYATSNPYAQQTVFSNVFRGTDNFLEFQKMQSMQAVHGPGQAKPAQSVQNPNAPYTPLTPLRPQSNSTIPLKGLIEAHSDSSQGKKDSGSYALPLIHPPNAVQGSQPSSPRDKSGGSTSPRTPPIGTQPSATLSPRTTDRSSQPQVQIPPLPSMLPVPQPSSPRDRLSVGSGSASSQSMSQVSPQPSPQPNPTALLHAQRSPRGTADRIPKPNALPNNLSQPSQHSPQQSSANPTQQTQSQSSPSATNLSPLNQQRSPRSTSDRSERIMVQHQAVQNRSSGPNFQLPQLPNPPNANPNLNPNATSPLSSPTHVERVRHANTNRGSS